jgi:hypothetical protein
VRKVLWVRCILLAIFLFSFIILFLIEDPLNLKSKITSFSALVPPDLLIEDAWYAVYFQNTFVGYYNFFMKILDLEEGGGYVLKSRARLKLPLLGTIKPLNLDGEVKLSNNYSLGEAHFKIESDNYFFKSVLMKEEENSYYLCIKTPTQNIKRTILMKDELVNSLLAPFSLNFVPLNKKTSFSFYDPFLDKKTTILLKNQGKEVIDIDGRSVEVYAIDINVEGIEGKIFADKKGRMVKEQFLGFTFVKEAPPSLFKKEFPSPGEDLVKYFTVEVEPLIKDKKDISYLKLKVYGIPQEYVREDFNQKRHLQDNAVIVEIYKKEPKKEVKLPIERDKFAPYLGEDEFIKFHNSIIKNTVHSIIKEEKNIFAILERISEWIDKSIKKIPTISFPNTLDVLKMKQGDCGEISALMVGFLRSLGIPSYVNIGLVYEGGKFFYHAWVSLYVGEWIDTDPALSQLVADPTHLKLLKGFKNQFEIFKIIGKLNIEVVEYR